MVDINQTMSLWTFNVSELNKPIKRQRLAEWEKDRKTPRKPDWLCCFYETEHPWDKIDFKKKKQCTRK